MPKSFEPWMSRSGAAARRDGPQTFGAAESQARKILFGLFALGISVAIGYGIIIVPAIILAGMLIAIVGAVVITKYPFFGLLLYAVLFIVRPGEMYPILAALHLERLIGSFTLLIMVLYLIRRNGGLVIDQSGQTKALLLFLVAIALSIPFSYWPGGSVATLTEMLKILGFYFMVVYLVDSPRKLKTFTWVYLLLVLYLDANALINYYHGNYAFKQGIDRATGTNSAAGNYNELGTTLAASVPLLLLLSRNETARFGRLMALGGGILAVWGLVLTGSRASLLGLLAGLIYLWTLSRRKLLVGAIGVMVLGSSYFVIPHQYQERYGTILHKHLDGSSQGRVQSWMTGLVMVADRPLFGVGAGCFGVAHAMNYSSQYNKRVWLESHSLYIQVLAELGLLGAVVFVIMQRQFLKLNRRTASLLVPFGNVRRVERAIMNGLFGGFIVLLVSGVFGHSLYRRTWYIYAGLGLAVYRMIRLELERRQSNPEKPPSERLPARRLR